jgi:spore germination protein YaaH
MLQGLLAATGLAVVADGRPAPASARAAGQRPVQTGQRISVDAWLYAPDPASFTALQREAPRIARVFPTWYLVNGDLSIASRSRRSIIQFARQQRLALLPVIRNAGFDPRVVAAVVQTAQARNAVARQIASLVLQHDYAGINVDFEGCFGAFRDQFSDFVVRLAELLHRNGKQVIVNVVPQFKPPAQYPNTSRAASYDYAALGRCCDALVLMAYAKSDQRPGSLSPLWWVRDATAYASSLIAAQQLVVGQAFYGRHWVIRGASIANTDLTQAQAETLLRQSGANVRRPAADATPWFSWQDGQGQHVAHYEDAVSLGIKLSAVLAQGIGGLAFWRFGQEEPSQWSVIAEAVRGSS